MRQGLGIGTPRGLQGRLRTLLSLLSRFWRRLTALSKLPAHRNHPHSSSSPLGPTPTRGPAEEALTTGCGQPGTRGILMARALSLHSRRITAMSERERITFTLEHVEKIYPGTRDNFEGGVTKCWDEDEWARGASAYYAPGQFSSLLSHVARPEGRIHFAGEHTSVWIDGWMQGALESGIRVAKEVDAARVRG